MGMCCATKQLTTALPGAHISKREMWAPGILVTRVMQSGGGGR
jgi:hypothetical protein